MNTMIDEKTEERNFGVWPVKEKVKVTLTLVETDPDKFGIYYASVYSGIAGGDTHGGPISISENTDRVINNDPKVTAIISNYSDDKANHLISFHVKLTVDAPVLGTITIFDQTLGGKYGTNAMRLMFEHLAEISQNATKMFQLR